MKVKPVVTHHRADDDTDTAFDFYLNEAGIEIAIAFIDELERGYSHIARHPLSGSTRFAEELGLPRNAATANETLSIPDLLRRERKTYRDSPGA